MMTLAKEKQPNQGLINKLRLPIVTSVVVILLVVGFILIQISRRALTRQIFHVQRKTAEEIALSIASYLQSAQEDLVVLGQVQDWSQIGRQEKRQAIERLLETRQQIYEEITFLDRAGNEVVKVSRFHTYLPEELGAQPHLTAFQRAIAGEKYRAEDIAISSNSGLPVVEVAVPVLDPASGNSVGVLLAQVSIKQMWDKVAEVGGGEAGYAYVINQSGHLLAHSNLERYLDLQDQDLKHVLAVRKIVSRFEEFVPSRYEGLEGENAVGAAAPIEGTYWFVITELPSSEAYASLRRMTVFLAGVLLVAGAAIGGLASWLPQRIVRRPLARLREGATLLSSGDLGHRIELQTGDELETLANTFNQMAEHLQELYADLERKVAERTHDLERRAVQLEAAAEVARDAAAIRDMDELLEETVQLISDQFGFYHAGIFLVDDVGRYAVLESASSPGGRRMLRRGHRLPVGEKGIVGYVAQTAEPRIALDVGEDAVHFANPDLPETRSEIALPLITRGEVIGVLDVQSTEVAAFDDGDVAILELVADQLAVALENARLLKESQQAIRELEATQGEYIRKAWGRLDQQPAFEYDRVDVRPVDPSSSPAIVHQTIEGGDVVAVSNPERRWAALSAPLRLRDQVIGALALEEVDGRKAWTADEIELVEEVSEQVALALENARLFEEAQIRADEMGILNELARSLSTQLNLEGVLDEAYQGTQRLLGASSFYVALYDRENERISFPLYVEEGEQVRRASRSMSNGLTEHVIRSQESMLLKDNPLERSREMGIEMKGRHPDSWLGVPLVVGEQVLGVMAVQSYAASEHYDEHDRELLNAIASQTAIALQNVYLFEETQRRARRERLVREVTAKIVRSTDLDTVLETTAQELGKVLGVPRTVVRLKTSESDNEGQAGGGEE